MRPLWRDLRSLTAATARIGEGDFATRAEVERSSLLAPIAEAFNRMSARVQALLRSHRDRVGGGPRIPLKGVEGYLRAEQVLGRIKAETDVEAAASLLLGACFQQAFLATFEESEPAELADRLADTLLAAL